MKNQKSKLKFKIYTIHESRTTSHFFTSIPYVSGLLFFKNPQPSRILLFLLKSTSTTTTSSFLLLALLSTFPKESQTKDCPQNSSFPSVPTLFTDATCTPLAIAWERWIISHASCQ